VIEPPRNALPAQQATHDRAERLAQRAHLLIQREALPADPQTSSIQIITSRAGLSADLPTVLALHNNILQQERFGF
jgi:precorrin-6B methylase 1